MKRDEIRKQIERNEQAIERSDRVWAEIERTVRESRRRTERAMAILRRAGYLRDS